jgi:hypothetical protein
MNLRWLFSLLNSCLILLLVIAAQELPVPLILKDTAMIATQDSQSDSEEDGHDYDISNEAIPILLKCKPEITGLRALADNDANNGLISEQDVHVQGESLVDSTNTGLLKSSDSLTCATKDATVQQLEYELAPGSLKAFQFQTDKEKMDLLSQKFGHSQKEAQGFGREQQSGGVEHSQVQKGSIISEPCHHVRPTVWLLPKSLVLREWKFQQMSSSQALCCMECLASVLKSHLKNLWKWWKPA